MKKNRVGELDVCTMSNCTARLLRNGMHVDKTGETSCLNALYERLTKKPSLTRHAINRSDR